MNDSCVRSRKNQRSLDSAVMMSSLMQSAEKYHARIVDHVGERQHAMAGASAQRTISLMGIKA